MTVKDIARLEKQIEALPEKLSKQIELSISAATAALELRITQTLETRLAHVEESTAVAHNRITECSTQRGKTEQAVTALAVDVSAIKAKRISAAPAGSGPKQTVIRFAVPVTAITALATAILTWLFG